MLVTVEGVEAAAVPVGLMEEEVQAVADGLLNPPTAPEPTPEQIAAQQAQTDYHAAVAARQRVQGLVDQGVIPPGHQAVVDAKAAVVAAGQAILPAVVAQIPKKK